MSSKELARKKEVERVIDQRITQKEASNKLGGKKPNNSIH